ncbi:hypothetical protein M3Y97_00636600 [Aphelenchoides bicaudatus]|nr:hypothetical protein M3Y97_00636600 [Aphelenchoides bicaudatus]
MRLRALLALAILLAKHDGVESQTNTTSATKIGAFKSHRSTYNSTLAEQSLMEIYDFTAEYLDQFDMSVEPCNNFNQFVCAKRSANNSNFIFYVKDILNSQLEGKQDDLDLIFVKLHNYSRSALQKFKDAVSTDEKKKQFIADEIFYFQEVTGVQNSIYNSTLNETDWSVDEALFGKTAGYLKRNLNADFLFNFSVKTVHKPNKNLDIYLDQQFDSTFNWNSSKLNICDEQLERLERFHKILHSTTGLNDVWEYVGRVEGFDRYENVPFLTYLLSLTDKFPRHIRDAVKFFTYVKDPEFLNKRMDIKRMKKEFDDDKSFKQTVHNYLTLVFKTRLEDQQIAVKAVYESRKERLQILERFNELTQRIKTEMKNLIIRLKGLENEERTKLLEKLDQTDPYFNGLFENYAEQEAAFKDQIDSLPEEEHLFNLFHLQIDNTFQESLNATNENQKHAIPLPIDVIPVDKNASFSIFTSLLQFDNMPDEIWYASVGPEIALKLWHPSGNKNIQELIDKQFKCFEEEYNETEIGLFPGDVEVRKAKTGLAVNEQIALKALHAALSSRISDYAIELEKCYQEDGDFYNEIYSTLKWDRLNEFSGAFQCSNEKRFGRCSLLEFGQAVETPPHWSLNIPPLQNNQTSPVLELLSRQIESHINIELNPCDSFFEYACSNVQTGSFVELEVNKFEHLEKSLMKSVKNSDPTLVKYMKKLYQKCIKDKGFTDPAFEDDQLFEFFHPLADVADLKGLTWTHGKMESKHLFVKRFFQTLGYLQRLGIASFINLEVLKLGNETILNIGYNPLQLILINERSSERRQTYWEKLKELGFAIGDVEEAMHSSDLFRAAMHLYSEKVIENPEDLVDRHLKASIVDFWRVLFDKDLPENDTIQLGASPAFLLLTETNSKLQTGAFNTLIEDALFYALDEYESTDCVGFVEKAASVSLARMVIEVRFPTKSQQDEFQNQLERYTQALKLAFRGMINQVNWMNEESKQTARRKLDNMKHMTAFTPFYTDDEIMEDVSKENKFNVEHPIKFKYFDNQLMQFRQTVFDEQSLFPMMDMLIPNAFYMQYGNQMNMLLGILDAPVYHPDYPVAAIFGQLGFAVGHEMIHGFDNSGIFFDENGKQLEEPWIDEPAVEKFNQVSDCIKKQYGDMCQTNDDGLKECIDAKETIGENIADNGGIRASYRAYRNWVSTAGDNVRLIGPLASQLTSDQLFFIRYAQFWCTGGRFTGNFLNGNDDEHSPHQARVDGVLANFPAFGEAFNCPADSVYGRNGHCQVWSDDIQSHLIDIYSTNKET